MALDGFPGQQQAALTALTWLRADRLPHAVLVAGPVGSGKREFAVELAKAALCPEPGPDACDGCPSCRKVQALAHPDVHLLVPLIAGRGTKDEAALQAEMTAAATAFLEGRVEVSSSAANISREHLRLLQRQMGYAPVEARRQVAVLLDAERMHPAGANSLLKMLEEPPGNSAFVLVSSAPDRLTATVRSRCQRLTLRRPGPETVRAALVAGGCSPERVELGVRLGAGNLRRARAAARGELDEARGAVEALLRAALAADDGVYWRLTEQFGARDARGELELVLQLCGLYLRDLFLGAGRGAARTMDDRGEVLEQLAASLTLEQVEAAAVELDRADEMLSRNVPANLALVGLWRCLRAGAMSSTPGLAPGSGAGRGARPRAAAT